MERSLFRAALASASLFVLTLPTAHGVGIDLNQHGLTGSWYEPRTSGQGFAVEVFPDLMSPGTGIVQVSWFTYDVIVGGAERQRWYTLSGPVVSGQPNASLAIYQNTGGNFNAPPVTTAHAVGTATLSFDSCTSGQLDYNFTDGSGRASTIALTRLMANVTCSETSERPANFDYSASGNWYDPATSGQGLSVEVNPVSRVLFFAWQTYAPNGAGAGSGGQRWFTGQGTYSSLSSPNPVQLYESTGGLFDEASAVVQSTVVVGSGTLSFCDAQLRFNFTGGSNVGMAGTIALVRVGPPVIGCSPWDYQ